MADDEEPENPNDDEDDDELDEDFEEDDDPEGPEDSPLVELFALGHSPEFNKTARVAIDRWFRSRENDRKAAHEASTRNHALTLAERAKNQEKIRLERAKLREFRAEEQLRWERHVTRAMWIRGALSTLTLSAIVFLAYADVLPKEGLVPLLTAVVASLFVTERRKE